jgi:hypothetical protein
MKQRLLFFSFGVFLIACSDDEKVSPAITAYDASVIEYFTEVALGFEFGGASEITRKWRTEMKIFVGGNKSQALIDELNSIVSEINSLATDGFSIRIVSDSLELNYYIFFGSADAYGKIYPSQGALAIDNWGLFNVSWNINNEIYSGNMYVDIDRANDLEEKHLLREELTQSLGLAKDSDRYANSIFQSDWTTTTQYADIDKDLIRLLYHPNMQIGLARANAEATVTQILLSEK